jgi:hypothetical protein
MEASVLVDHRGQCNLDGRGHDHVDTSAPQAQAAMGLGVARAPWTSARGAWQVDAVFADVAWLRARTAWEYAFLFVGKRRT